MTRAEKFLALRSVALLGELTDSDIALIADVAVEKRFAAAEEFCAAGQRLRRLYIVLEGGVETEAGRPMPAVLGAASMLYDLPVAGRLRATAGGARCLVVARAHFFTIVRQCPGILCSGLESDVVEVRSDGEGGVG